MRKVILSMMVSLDGYIEGPGNDINWHVWNKEMDNYMGGFFNRIDTLIFGRKTFEMMEAYWPNASAPQDDPVITKHMNKLQKFVFSRTLSAVKWENSHLVKGGIKEEVGKWKLQSGKDMVIFGGAELASSFIKMGLIDEYQLIYNPVVLGNGTPLFKNIEKQFKLTPKGAKVFECGNIIHYFEP